MWTKDSHRCETLIYGEEDWLEDCLMSCDWMNAGYQIEASATNVGEIDKICEPTPNAPYSSPSTQTLVSPNRILRNPDSVE
jgi:hypothetical protein